MIALLCFVLNVLVSPFKSKNRLEAENAALRHQVVVLRRIVVHMRVRLTNSDRIFFIQLYRWFPSVLKVITVIRPETLVRWHRAGFMGIRDKPIAPGSPWQNGFAERLIGSIPRECLDHFVVWGEAHLRRILQSYIRYYNNIRTHRSLDKDAPVSRPVQRNGSINSYAVLGGLHHQYLRV